METVDVIILSRSDDPHIDFVTPVMENEGISFFRINTDSLFLNGGISYDSHGAVSLFSNNREINLSNIKAIWNRRPQTLAVSPELTHVGMREFCAREMEMALWGILIASNARWVNHPNANKLANYKLAQINLVSTLKFLAPKTLISNNRCAVVDFLKNNDRVIYKPLTWGVIDLDGQSTGAIYTSEIHLTDEVANGASLAPGIYQELINKKSDVRVTVFGNKCFAVSIDSGKETDIDVRKNMINLDHSVIELPKSVEDLCMKMLAHYGLCFGCFDFIISESGDWYFIELNPNGQWGWIEKKTELPLRKVFCELLASS